MSLLKQFLIFTLIGILFSGCSLKPGGEVGDDPCDGPDAGAQCDGHVVQPQTWGGDLVVVNASLDRNLEGMGGLRVPLTVRSYTDDDGVTQKPGIRSLADYTWEFYGGPDAFGLALEFRSLNLEAIDPDETGDICLLVMTGDEADADVHMGLYDGLHAGADDHFWDGGTASNYERNLFSSEICNPSEELMAPQGPIVQVIKHGHVFPDGDQVTQYVPGRLIRWRLVANAMTLAPPTNLNAAPPIANLFDLASIRILREKGLAELFDGNEEVHPDDVEGGDSEAVYVRARLNRETLGFLEGRDAGGRQGAANRFEHDQHKAEGNHYVVTVPEGANLDVFLDVPIVAHGMCAEAEDCSPGHSCTDGQCMGRPDVRITTRVDGAEYTSNVFFDHFTGVAGKTVTVTVWTPEPALKTTYNLMINYVRFMERLVSFDWDLTDPFRGHGDDADCEDAVSFEDCVRDYLADFDERVPDTSWTWASIFGLEFNQEDLCENIGESDDYPGSGFCPTDANQYRFSGCVNGEDDCYSDLRSIPADWYAWITGDWRYVGGAVCDMNQFCPFMHRYSQPEIIRASKRILLEANRELLAATDGFFRINAVNIVQDPGEEWDIDFLNQGGLRAHAVFGLSGEGVMNLGVNHLFNYNGRWSGSRNQSRTLVHEAGHSYFEMFDEYRYDGRCPHSLMDLHDDTFDFCTLLNHDPRPVDEVSVDLSDEMWHEKVIDDIEGLGAGYESWVNAGVFHRRYGTPNPFLFHADLVQSTSAAGLAEEDKVVIDPLDRTVVFKAVDDSEAPATDDSTGFISCVVDEAVEPWEACGHGVGIYETWSGWSHNFDNVNPFLLGP